MRCASIGAAYVLIAIAIFFARPLPTPGPQARDFEAYWSAGATWNAHADAYGRDIWQSERQVPGVDATRDEILPFVGPPATLLIWSAFARLPYAIAARIWWALLALALAALIGIVIASSTGKATAAPLFAAVALAIGFGPVTSDLALGQLALLAFAGAAAVTMPYAAGAAASFLAFLQPNVALGLLSLLGRNRTTLAIVSGGVLAYLAGALAMGWRWPLAYAQLLAAHGAAERTGAIQISPASIAFGFGASSSQSSLTALLVALAAVAAAIAIARRVEHRFARFAAFSALVPFVAGFFHEHDLVVAYAAALWCAIETRGLSRAVALVGTLLVAIDWLGLAQRPTGMLQSTLLATAALCAFVALGPELDLRRALAAAAVPTATFVVAAWVAVLHPAPVWPDTLGAFHAAPTLSIARIWMEEQNRSGLLAAVPAWSFLRSLSLCGCGLLAYAIYRHSRCCRTASTYSDASP